ncbi:hypothetical protein [Herbaspirillum sp. YR522]|uniref:hypothetical protein n=1 Tax=Herbaspirillum sp. YR522 TaxID=1144342 RepID=UPI001EE6819D|nr:hypothetical protein [Herbaspirillum sp. YR522]
MPQVIMMRRSNARADPAQDHVAGHFEDQVADEEDARPQAVDGVVELERIEHLQLGEADVDAVQVRHQVAGQDQRQ